MVVVKRTNHILRIVATYSCIYARRKNAIWPLLPVKNSRAPSRSPAQNSPLRLEFARPRPATGTARWVYIAGGSEARGLWNIAQATLPEGFGGPAGGASEGPLRDDFVVLVPAGSNSSAPSRPRHLEMTLRTSRGREESAGQGPDRLDQFASDRRSGAGG